MQVCFLNCLQYALFCTENSDFRDYLCGTTVFISDLQIEFELSSWQLLSSLLLLQKHQHRVSWDGSSLWRLSWNLLVFWYLDVSFNIFQRNNNEQEDKKKKKKKLVFGSYTIWFLPVNQCVCTCSSIFLSLSSYIFVTSACNFISLNLELFVSTVVMKLLLWVCVLKFNKTMCNFILYKIFLGIPEFIIYKTKFGYDICINNDSLLFNI